MKRIEVFENRGSSEEEGAGFYASNPSMDISAMPSFFRGVLPAAGKRIMKPRLVMRVYHLVRELT